MSNGTGTRWRFLVVEDNADLARELKEATPGFVDPPDTADAETVTTFEEATDRMRFARYDLLILDLKDEVERIQMQASETKPMNLTLGLLSDGELVILRAALEIEMKKRKVAFSVGEVGERLAIEHFLKTPGLPKLQLAQKGTKNMDASSRNGERYSIKTICKTKKTGTIYPDSEDKNKQLFEYLLN